MRGKKYGRSRQATDDTIIRRMRFACRITKATDTHSEYVIILLHGNNGCANVSQCYVYMYSGCICIHSLKPTTYTHFGRYHMPSSGSIVTRLNPATNGFNHPAVSLLIWRCAFGWFNIAIHRSEMHGMDRFKITASLV